MPRPPRRRKWPIALVLLILAVPIVWYLGFNSTGSNGQPTPASSSSATSSGSTLSGTEAKRLESGLSGSNTADYRALWVAKDYPSPPTGRTAVTLDNGTFVIHGKYGRIDADIASAGKTTRWRLLLLRADAHWNIYTMTEVK